MDDATKYLWQAGQALREYAKSEAEIGWRRGLVNELFPDIYEASKRMSTRSISRWLKEVQSVQLSPATISKALREQTKYWIEFYEFIEPYARIFGAVHVSSPDGEFDADSILGFDREVFRALSNQEPSFACTSGEAYQLKLKEYNEAAAVLRERWFALNEETRDTCLASQPDDPDESEEEPKVP